MEKILEVKGLKKLYSVRKFLGRGQTITALDEISFELYSSETLGIIGESGSGKTTLALILMGLVKADAGDVFYRGENLFQLYRRNGKIMRRKIQIIFQDPFNTLNPRFSIGATLLETLKVHKIARANIAQKLVIETIKQVGLNEEYLEKYPHQLSGGERQRVAIARALILRPEVLICDEPVSSLDLSIQAQILKLLLELQDTYKLSMIFISHDINVVALMSHRIMVLYQGKILEIGKSEEIITKPSNPYTKNLLQLSKLS